jgi:hypothetical protein
MSAKSAPRRSNGCLKAPREAGNQTVSKATLELFARGAVSGHHVGVHGGLVQGTLGNPLPIRICDYDGPDDDLPDMDERGQRCNMWFEPSDEAHEAQLKRRA